MISKPALSMLPAESPSLIPETTRQDSEAPAQSPNPNTMKRRVGDVDSVGSSKRHKPTVNEPQKHARCWDEHGNVILQIEATLFRLHGPILARQSIFFEELFRCKAEIFEGIPLHFVSSTNVKDFEVLLFVLENAVTYFIEPPSFEVVASLLRVSTVLKFPKFREFAVHSLTCAWTDQLESFSKDSKWLEYAAETVILAREYDVAYVLKRALYELIRVPGFTKNSEASISNSDLRLLSRAREHLSEVWMSVALVPAPEPCGQANGECRGFYKQLLNALGFAVYMHDPISGIVRLVDIANRSWTSKVCRGCLTEKVTYWTNQRALIWASLDEWLELKQ